MKMRAVSVPDPLWEEAVKLAQQEGISAAELVRRGLMREIAWIKMRRMRARSRRSHRP